MLSYCPWVSILFSVSYLCCHSQFCFHFLTYFVIHLLILNFVFDFLPMLSYFSWVSNLFSVSYLCCHSQFCSFSNLFYHTSLDYQFCFQILTCVVILLLILNGCFNFLPMLSYFSLFSIDFDFLPTQCCLVALNSQFILLFLTYLMLSYFSWFSVLFSASYLCCRIVIFRMMRRKRMVPKRRGRARVARTATTRGRKRRKVTTSSQ
jgi:hypothetical protein